MPAFIVSIVAISDPVKFKAYGETIAGLSEKFGGEYVVRGTVTEVLEGAPAAGERVVVLRFPSGDKAREFYNSETYQIGKERRAGAAEVTMRLIEV